MTNKPSPQLLDVQVPRSLFVAALRRYDGLAYSSSTNVWLADGRPMGEVSCFGLIFAALRDVGLLPAEFDPNVSCLPRGYPQAAYFREMLRAGGTPIEKGRGMLPGDLLLTRWHDVVPALTEPHHIAAYTDDKPWPYGRFIQSLDAASRGQNRVYESIIDQMEWNRIDEVWRINNLVGDAA